MNRLALLPLLLLLAGCVTPAVNNTTVTPGPIGGERDSHGCLGPAGYSWNSSLEACVREWELSHDDGTRDAVRIAAATYADHDGLTVVKTEIYRCPGCFTIWFEQNSERSEVFLSDWKVTTNGCGPCPMFAPPADGWCNYTVVAGDVDECGCRGPPKCLVETKCTAEQRGVQVCTMEYNPVCGWFNQSIQCFAYPCAATYSNPCMACADDKVAGWTEGECPKTVN